MRLGKLIGDFSSFSNLECSELQVLSVEIKQEGWLLIISHDKNNFITEDHESQMAKNVAYSLFKTYTIVQ